MKKIKLSLLGLMACVGVFAQCDAFSDPGVGNLAVLPTSYSSLNQLGSVSFEVGNYGNSSFSGVGILNQMKVKVNLNKLAVVDASNVLNNLSGPGVSYFNWTLVSPTEIFGQQKEGVAIGEFTQLLVTVQTIYTGPAVTVSPNDIGLRVTSTRPFNVCSTELASNNEDELWVNFSAVFPVELINFNAVKNGSSPSSLLTWATSSEENSKQFDVYRSTDGSNWEKIGEVAAAGNSTSRKNYQLIDGTPSLTKKNFYKLKIVDLDATSKESTIRWVTFSGNSAITLFPNPVRGKLVINGLQEAKEVILFDAVGKLLQRVRVTSASEEISMERYARGAYNVQIVGNNGETLQTTKVLKD